MKLTQVLEGIPISSVHGELESVDIQSIAYDARQTEQGSLFCTWKGERNDGHAFIPQALERGAVAVLGESNMEMLTVPYIQTNRPRSALAKASANFYHHPSSKLGVIGVTGTNGKTSVCRLIQHILNTAKHRCGLIGTIGIDHGKGLEPVERTTPEGLDLQETFSRMLNASLSHVAMEVSSHALDQGRVEGTSFGVGVFTNLTQDHLDYHQTMENYLKAKLMLFENLSPQSIAVVNADDVHAEAFIQAVSKDVRVVTYAIDQAADVRAVNLHMSDQGCRFDVEIGGEFINVQTPWLGRFNVLNTLAAMATASALNVPAPIIQQAVLSSPVVAGRMERVKHEGEFTVLVDYAHTDDALKNALQTLRPLTSGKLYVVVGCGGNRDRSKRPLMARVACDYADHAVFTSDNPRHEDPKKILEDMTQGVEDCINFEVIIDRRDALESCLSKAVKGDVVLIAGKGHEDTQEIHGVKHPFSDVLHAQRILSGGVVV